MEAALDSNGRYIAAVMALTEQKARDSIRSLQRKIDSCYQSLPWLVLGIIEVGRQRWPSGEACDGAYAFAIGERDRVLHGESLLAFPSSLSSPAGHHSL